MTSFGCILRSTVLSALRDRVLHAILAVTLLMLFMIPVLSSFSMRQVLEFAITFSLSFSSFVLVILALLLGSTSLWRDMEKRYTATVLGLPLTRGCYVLGRFTGLAVFLSLCGLLLMVASALVIYGHIDAMSSGLIFSWQNILVALIGDLLKSILLLAVAFLFSTVSTSYFLPIFGTVGVYFAGGASQEVMDFLSTDAGLQLPTFSRFAAQAFYYLVPNLEIFNFKVAAIYGLPLSWAGAFYAVFYFAIYTALILMLAVCIFNRRELP